MIHGMVVRVLGENTAVTQSKMHEEWERQMRKASKNFEKART